MSCACGGAVLGVWHERDCPYRPGWYWGLCRHAKARALCAICLPGGDPRITDAALTRLTVEGDGNGNVTVTSSSHRGEEPHR